MDASRLAAIRARVEAAQDGPWKTDGVYVSAPSGRPVDIESGWVDGAIGATPNAEFIAHARDDVPALLAEVERLTAALVQAQGEGYSMNASTVTDQQLWESLSELLGVPEIAYSDDWNRCGLVLEAMRGRGYQALVSVSPTGGCLVGFGLVTKGVTMDTRADTAPRAVAEAARSALMQ